MSQPPAAEPSSEVAPLLPSEGLLDPATWSALVRRLLERAVDYLPSFVAALLVLGAFLVLARISARLLGAFLGRTGADPALIQLATRLLRSVVVIFGVIMAASQAGLAVGSLLAGVGVVGLAVGLAAQDTLANVVAGLTILWDRPFRIGDTVTIAERYGRVLEIGLRTTRVRTVDARDVLLPNKEVIENMIVNHTLNPELRLDVPLGIGYAEDSRQARAVLLAAVEGHPRILASPAPQVVMVGLADSAVELELRVWLREPAEERPAFCEVLELAKIALDEAGIEIPFPQRTLHLAAGSPALSIRRLGEDD